MVVKMAIINKKIKIKVKIKIKMLFKRWFIDKVKIQTNLKNNYI